MKWNKTLLASLIVLSVGIGLAVAQTYPAPKVVNVGPKDLFRDVVSGVGSAQSVYATAAQITNVQGYLNLGTVTTDPTPAIANGVTNIFAHGTGAITLVTPTLPPNPADGARVCYWADQTTTTLTWTANTGQTVSNAHAAGVQYISNCLTYQASNATWYPSN